MAHSARAKEQLIAKYEELGRVDLACQASGIPRRNHYRWMKESRYRKSFESARANAVSMLEDEAYRRAVQGVSRPVMHAGEICKVDGKMIVETTYSDLLLIFLMKASDPARYRERVSMEHTGKDGVSLFDAAAIRAYIKAAPEDGE